MISNEKCSKFSWGRSPSLTNLFNRFLIILLFLSGVNFSIYDSVILIISIIFDLSEKIILPTTRSFIFSVLYKFFLFDFIKYFMSFQYIIISITIFKNSITILKLFTEVIDKIFILSIIQNRYLSHFR